MKALVLGLGISGQSAVALLKRRGAQVVVCDDRLCPKHFPSLQNFDLFVPSPGIPKTHSIYQKALEEGIAISGEIDLFLQEATHRCIGITGTNGKTTTVSMVSHLLSASGIPAIAAGNIGVPLSDVPKGVVCVLELSSFQLETINTPSLEMGVILNITADHLDRYPNFEAYRSAKLRLKHAIKKGGKLFLHHSIATQGLDYPFEQFQGGNLEVAQLICRDFGIENFSSLKTFKRPPHRLEFVEIIDDITYINDSKATNIEAVLYALTQVKKIGVLILGGRDKGLSFKPLIEAIPSQTQIFAYGEAREKIANQLQPLRIVHLTKTLKSAVEKGAAVAPKGSSVLLSPGCTSFDAFENYQARGEAFKAYVRRSLLL